MPTTKPAKRTREQRVSLMPDKTALSLASVQAAFEIFERQSQKLQSAYQALERDLAISNQTLQERNRELTCRNQDLRQVSSRLESVIESLTDGLLVIGVDFHIERCNATACRLFEAPREQIEGATFNQIIGEEPFQNALETVLQGSSPMLDMPWTKAFSESEHGHVHILLSLAPVTAPDGNILGAVCNLRDVTAFRRMEKRLQSQQRLAALGEMAASVAHEIRNPLGTIEGFARLLRRDLQSMPEPLRLAERIVAGAQNLNYVITNLLTYARPMRLHISNVTVRNLFETCSDTLEDRAARTGVRLCWQRPEKDIVLSGDQRQLAQSLLNLGINAIEACEHGHSVTIGARESHRTVLIQVEDNGCGMDEEQSRKVFDPFYTTKEGGTGLGLSLTRKIIDAHGGEITLKSSPGEGTSFIIELPKTGVTA